MTVNSRRRLIDRLNLSLHFGRNGQKLIDVQFNLLCWCALKIRPNIVSRNQNRTERSIPNWGPHPYWPSLTFCLQERTIVKIRLLSIDVEVDGRWRFYKYALNWLVSLTNVSFYWNFTLFLFVFLRAKKDADCMYSFLFEQLMTRKTIVKNCDRSFMYLTTCFFGCEVLFFCNADQLQCRSTKISSDFESS